MSERPIQQDRLADVSVPSSALTPEVSRAASTPAPLAPVEAAVLSLPPASQDADTIPPDALVIPKKKPQRPPHWKIPKDSIVRKKALAIVAMRANGMHDEQIGKELGISTRSVRVYLYRATKSGFLVNRKTGFLLTDPHDRIDFDIAQKAVDNLSKMLDSDEKLSQGEKSVRMETTLAVLKGVLFKKYDQPKEAAMNTNILQINIQGHQEAVDPMAGGTPLYLDGEVLGGDEE